VGRVHSGSRDPPRRRHDDLGGDRRLQVEPHRGRLFPAVFAVLTMAFHEALVQGQQKVSDYESAKHALTSLDQRIDTGRRSVASEERRKNIEVIKGLLAGSLVPARPPRDTAAKSTIDIDSALRRSQIELPRYELKQGLLRLDAARTLDNGVPDQVVKTICAMANIGPDSTSTIIVGVTDDQEDAKRVTLLDGIQPRVVGKRFVVGIAREATVLGESVEQYFARWKTAIQNSALSSPLRESVLTRLDYNEYYGLGVVVITVPEQDRMGTVSDRAYWRDGDETKEAAGASQVAEIAARFR